MTLTGYLINLIKRCFFFNLNVCLNDNYDCNTHILKSKGINEFSKLYRFDIFHHVRCFCVRITNNV